MTIPWGPLACLAGALVVALLYKRFMPAEHQTVRSPVFWMFLLVGTFVFGGLAFSLLPQRSPHPHRPTS